MVSRNMPNKVQVMLCRLFRTKPSTETILCYFLNFRKYINLVENKKLKKVYCKIPTIFVKYNYRQVSNIRRTL